MSPEQKNSAITNAVKYMSP